MFDARYLHAYSVALHLLSSSTEHIRLQALKIIGKVLHSATHK